MPQHVVVRDIFVEAILSFHLNVASMNSGSRLSQLTFSCSAVSQAPKAEHTKAPLPTSFCNNSERTSQPPGLLLPCCTSEQPAGFRPFFLRDSGTARKQHIFCMSPLPQTQNLICNTTLSATLRTRDKTMQTFLLSTNTQETSYRINIERALTELRVCLQIQGLNNNSHSK